MRRVPSGLVLGVLALSAAALRVIACSDLRGSANPEVPQWVHRPSYSLSVTYSRNLLAASRQEGEPYERGQPEIDAENHRVFVGSSDRGLYALDAARGITLWRFETLGPVQGEPLYDPGENVVYFGSNDGALYKVQADRGELLWRFSTNAEVARRPILDGDTLYAVNANDTLLALDPTSGKRKWSQHRAPALGMEVAGYSGALVWQGNVYQAFSDGTVAAYDARTGAERWQPLDLSAEAEQLLGTVPKYLDVDTTPVAYHSEVGPLVIVGSYEAGVFALDAQTGTQVWSNTSVQGVSDLMLWTQPAHPPRDGAVTVPAKALLIASTGVSGLWALDPETGERVWHQDLPNGGVSRPVSAVGALMVSTTKQGLFLISPLDGGIIDGIHSDLGFAMTPAAFGHRAYVVTNGGTFIALSIEPPLTPYQLRQR